MNYNNQHLTIMKTNNRKALPYEAPEVKCMMFSIDRSFCASNYAARNEDFEEFEIEYTLE